MRKATEVIDLVIGVYLCNCANEAYVAALIPYVLLFLARLFLAPDSLYENKGGMAINASV